MTTNYIKDQGPDFRNEIQRVAIIGAGGTVGKPIAQELLKTGKHTVTALTRVGGQNTLPEGIQTVLVDYHDETSLVNALKGQDALVITLSVTAAPDTHSKIVQAAAKAGVKYVMPNVWGCDAANDSLVNSGLGWERVPKSFDEIEKTGVSSWIALICGFCRERYEQALERVRNGDHGAFVQAMYSRVLFPNGDADYESKHGLANEPLGVPQEDLDTQTRNAKAMVDQGYDYMTKRN
ncbi:hypothetical protein APSETT445_006192 [Aspergillus pseudonomiae]